MRNCENCETEHTGEYKSGRFCSLKCSKSFSTKSKRNEINEAVSVKLTGRGNPPVSKECKNCNNKFEVIWRKRNQIFCSRSCTTSYKNKTMNLASLGGLKSATSQSRRSKNEILFYEMCIEKFPDSLANEPMFDGWDGDIIIPSKKVAILWNGIWHYKQISKSQSLDQVQTRDKIKIEKIKQFGFYPYIIKDLGKYNPTFVKEEFENFIKSL